MLLSFHFSEKLSSSLDKAGAAILKQSLWALKMLSRYLKDHFTVFFIAAINIQNLLRGNKKASMDFLKCYGFTNTFIKRQCHFIRFCICPWKCIVDTIYIKNKIFYISGFRCLVAACHKLLLMWYCILHKKYIYYTKNTFMKPLYKSQRRDLWRVIHCETRAIQTAIPAVSSVSLSSKSDGRVVIFI